MNFSQINDPHTLRLHLRAIGALLLSTISFMMSDPGIYILVVKKSMYYQIAHLIGSPLYMACSFFAASLLLVPFIAVLIFFPTPRYRRITSKLACCGLYLGATLWIFIAWYSRNWDIPAVGLIYLRNGILCLFVAIVLGVILNNNLKAKKLDDLGKGIDENSPHIASEHP